MLRKSHTWRFCARTVVMLVMPKTKQIASRIFDLPLPLRPVMELKASSLWHVSCAIIRSWIPTHHPEITVRTAYDLKPYKRVSSVQIDVVGGTYVDDHFDNPHRVAFEAWRLCCWIVAVLHQLLVGSVSRDAP